MAKANSGSKVVQKFFRERPSRGSGPVDQAMSEAVKDFQDGKMSEQDFVKFVKEHVR